jgi:hypothetical protein
LGFVIQAVIQSGRAFAWMFLSEGPGRRFVADRGLAGTTVWALLKATVLAIQPG